MIPMQVSYYKSGTTGAISWKNTTSGVCFIAYYQNLINFLVYFRCKARPEIRTKLVLH